MTIRNRFDLSLDEGRLSYLSAAVELLVELGSEPEREIYGTRVAGVAGVTPESVRNEVTKKRRSKMSKQKKDFEKRVARPAAANQPEDRSLRYSNEGSAFAEEGLIRCLARDSALMRVIIETGFSRDEFTSLFLAKVYDNLSGRITEGRDTKEAMILAELPANEASHLTTILQKPESVPNSERTIRGYIEKIRAEKFRRGAPDTDMLLEIKRYREKKDSGG